MNNTTAPESVILKIQALFEMATHQVHGGSNSEAEASAAMAKAQELLAKYNLDLQMVQTASVPGGIQKEEKREQTQNPRTAMYQWQQDLCRAICEANFCWYWITRTTDRFQVSGGMKKEHDRERKVKRHTILGRQGNVTVVQVMYEYLVDTIERIIPYTGADRLSRSANSWRIGCAERLIERINEKAARLKKEGIKTEETEVVTSTALIVQDYFDKEYAANYDACYGEGAYARSKAREVEYAKAREERKQEELEKLANETPEQKAKRLREEAKEQARQKKASERYWKHADARFNREMNRRDHSAYEQGRTKAEDIGLDQQIKTGSHKGELK